LEQLAELWRKGIEHAQERVTWMLECRRYSSPASSFAERSEGRSPATEGAMLAKSAADFFEEHSLQLHVPRAARWLAAIGARSMFISRPRLSSYEGLPEMAAGGLHATAFELFHK
jgi:hypothetical protein